jgi:hypothetical protein
VTATAAPTDTPRGGSDVDEPEMVDEGSDWRTGPRMEPGYLSREEIIAIIDREARLRRGWSARHLLRAERTGRLAYRSDVIHIFCAADLLDHDDPIWLPPPRRQRPVR